MQCLTSLPYENIWLERWRTHSFHVTHMLQYRDTFAILSISGRIENIYLLEWIFSKLLLVTRIRLLFSSVRPCCKVHCVHKTGTLTFLLCCSATINRLLTMKKKRRATLVQTSLRISYDGATNCIFFFVFNSIHVRFVVAVVFIPILECILRIWNKTFKNRICLLIVSFVICRNEPQLLRLKTNNNKIIKSSVPSSLAKKNKSKFCMKRKYKYCVASFFLVD